MPHGAASSRGRFGSVPTASQHVNLLQTDRLLQDKIPYTSTRRDMHIGSALFQGCGLVRKDDSAFDVRILRPFVMGARACVS